MQPGHPASSWITHLFDKSRQRGTLLLTDLYDLLPEYKSEQLTARLEQEWLDELKRAPLEPSLSRATLRTMRWKPVLIGLGLIPVVSADRSDARTTIAGCD